MRFSMRSVTWRAVGQHSSSVGCLDACTQHCLRPPTQAPNLRGYVQQATHLLRHSGILAARPAVILLLLWQRACRRPLLLRLLGLLLLLLLLPGGKLGLVRRLLLLQLFQPCSRVGARGHLAALADLQENDSPAEV